MTSAIKTVVIQAATDGSRSEVEEMKERLTNAYKGNGSRIGQLVGVLVEKIEAGDISTADANEVLDHVERLHEQQFQNIRCYRDRFQSESQPDPEPTPVPPPASNEPGQQALRKMGLL